MQRYYFWACELSGAAGHTYGANGIWQVNRREQSWGDIPWDEAARLPGAAHIAHSKALLMRLRNYWMASRRRSRERCA